VVEIERHLFSGQMNHHTVACCTYKVERHLARQVPSFLTLTFQSFTACCTAPTSHSMAGEADQTPRIVNEHVIDENKSGSEMESNVPMVSPSSHIAATKIAKKTTLEMVDYWNKTLVTETDRQAHHSFG
jgi:hypothetical protein